MLPSPTVPYMHLVVGNVLVAEVHARTHARALRLFMFTEG